MPISCRLCNRKDHEEVYLQLNGSVFRCFLNTFFTFLSVQTNQSPIDDSPLRGLVHPLPFDNTSHKLVFKLRTDWFTRSVYINSEIPNASINEESPTRRSVQRSGTNPLTSIRLVLSSCSRLGLSELRPQQHRQRGHATTSTTSTTIALLKAVSRQPKQPSSATAATITAMRRDGAAMKPNSCQSQAAVAGEYGGWYYREREEAI